MKNLIKRVIDLHIKILKMIIDLLNSNGISVKKAIFVVAIFSALGSVLGYQGFAYVAYDAGFCGVCHAHDYANTGWEDSAHFRATTCHDCHHQSLYANARSLYFTVFDRSHIGKVMHEIPAVEDIHCEKCHVEQPEGAWLDILGPLKSHDVGRIIKIMNTKGHRIHVGNTTDVPPDMKKGHGSHDEEPHPEGLRKIGCQDCHGSRENRAHNFNASPQTCERCHKGASSKHAGDPHLAHNCSRCHFVDFLSVETVNPYEREEE
jgi:hypothetical protein